MQEVIKEFLVESHENLAQLDSDLVALEKAPDERGTLSRIFRTLHTTKGSCAFLGFKKLQTVAHAGETLLDKLRNGERVVTQETISVLLAVVDAIREMLAAIEVHGHDGDREYSLLIDSLSRLARGADPTTTTAATARASTTPLPDSGTQVLVPDTPAPQAPPTVLLDAPDAHDPGIPAAQPEDPSALRETATPAVLDTTVRLDVQLLDKLMLLVSELVLARNQIADCVSRIDAEYGGDGLVAASRQIALVTSELQEQVMKTRLQPIAIVWNRLPRLVRDLAVQCRKQVEIEMEGGETELDKAIIEAIRDPLTHVLRNAVDHGIEPPHQRQSAGKPPAGKLRLHAFHERGRVNIEVTDDGAGIDPEIVRRRAIERDLIRPDHADAMDEQSILNLLFVPGFSTATRVSHVSGRGVGMDVVKTNIERIGGTIDLDSRLGHGTSVRMRIPLTLAIIKALIVTTCGQRFAIPQASIVELDRLERGKTRKALERFQDVLVLRFRDRLLPVVDLSHVLAIQRATSLETQGIVNLAILQAGESLFALVVDTIIDTHEIVIKPLWNRLRGIQCYAGATIMGDGQVALILDVFGLAQRANVVARSRDAMDFRPSVPGAAAARDRFVLAEDSDRCRFAIPLDQVARLEEFPRSRLERLGDRLVVQYRDEILPLLDVARCLNGGDAAGVATAGSCAADREAELVPVVVYSKGGRSVGLIVNSILDIAQPDLVVKHRATRDNVLYCTVIHDHVTEILDVEKLIRASDPAFFADPSRAF